MSRLMTCELPLVNDVWHVCWLNGSIRVKVNIIFSIKSLTVHPCILFKLGVMWIMWVVEWMNECSWSSFAYLDLNWDCHWLFRWVFRSVKQWPRSRTFLNSLRNFPIWSNRPMKILNRCQFKPHSPLMKL